MFGKAPSAPQGVNYVYKIVPHSSVNPRSAPPRRHPHSRRRSSPLALALAATRSPSRSPPRTPSFSPHSTPKMASSTCRRRRSSPGRSTASSRTTPRSSSSRWTTAACRASRLSSGSRAAAARVRPSLPFPTPLALARRGPQLTHPPLIVCSLPAPVRSARRRERRRASRPREEAGRDVVGRRARAGPPRRVAQGLSVRLSSSRHTSTVILPTVVRSLLYRRRGRAAVSRTSALHPPLARARFRSLCAARVLSSGSRLLRAAAGYSSLASCNALLSTLERPDLTSHRSLSLLALPPSCSDIQLVT